MGYYSNLHIARQWDCDNYECLDWDDEYDYLLDDLCAELESCNEHRPKDWNDQYFAAGLAKAASLRTRIMKIRKRKAIIVCFASEVFSTLLKNTKYA